MKKPIGKIQQVTNRMKTIQVMKQVSESLDIFRIPVKVGEEYDVKIEAMSKRGDAGVAKIEGMVIFVANTKEGDEVKIKISRVGMGYAIAEVVQQWRLVW